MQFLLFQMYNNNYNNETHKDGSKSSSLDKQSTNLDFDDQLFSIIEIS